MKKSILVLGSSGMLGSMVHQYLSHNQAYQVTGTLRKKNDAIYSYFNATEFIENPSSFSYIVDFDYIVNCIGIIKPYCKDTDSIGVQNAILVNALFPHRLAGYLRSHKTRIIQIATDCVYSGKEGYYSETAPHDPLDAYGKTKSLGEVQSPNFLNIRCSIIGPEKGNYLSLLEWFLHQPDGAELSGFTNHTWNGITTLQFAELCERLIHNNYFDSLRSKSHLYHYVPNTTVDKYQLLKIFAKVFQKSCQIRPIESTSGSVNRTLTSQIKGINPPKLTNMQAAISKLKKFMEAKQ